MSESFLERLSRFTPASGLDRDALLFAAGRASARPSRPWMALGGTLAATQLVSLVLLWPHASPQAQRPMASTRPAENVEISVPATEASSLWNLREKALASDGDLAALPPTRGSATADAPLRAFTAGSLDRFN
jgi:hypothetical protein